MDGPMIAQILEAQKQQLQAAKQRRGQRATNKPSRQQLIYELRQNGTAEKYPHTMRTTQINHAYPPCVTKLIELKPIAISELRLETHHVGKVLIVRTITDAVRLSSVMNAIEDKNSNVDKLAVYNFDSKIAPAYILPKNAVFAIKEPYYKAAANGGYIVRVDHPSDLIQLQPTHPMMPIELTPRLLELDKDAMKLKNVGNAAFKDKKYTQAQESYTEALAHCVDGDDALEHDLYRNRSIVNMYLQNYEDAVADAGFALVADAGDDETAKKNNVKALYRAGRALYCLERFAEAKDGFEKLLHISPNDKDGLEQLANAEARLREAVTGSYDFTAISKQVDAGIRRLDHASFTENVDVRTSTGKGRGLFATKDIKAGEVVLVEKAFAIANDADIRNETHIIINLNSNTGRMGTHANLYYQLVQKMQRNPEQAKTALKLFDGGYSPKCTADIIDGKVVIDTFQAAAIMEHNCFGCPEKRTADEIRKKKAEERDSKSVGIWITASYINHACDANSQRAFMGDLMVVHATKAIDRDEEITLRYRAPEMDNDKTVAELQKIWKFKCDCSICAAEAKSTAAQRKERKALIKDLEAFLKKYPKADEYHANKALIKQAEQLYAKLDAAYNKDKHTFAHIPRIGLAKLGGWLCGAHQTERSLHKVPDIANRVLQDMGHGVEAKGQELTVDTTHCFAQIEDIDAAMYAAHAYFYLRKVVLGKQYEEFAKQRYKVLCGEMKGFVERYGNSDEILSRRGA